MESFSGGMAAFTLADESGEGRGESGASGRKRLKRAVDCSVSSQAEFGQRPAAPVSPPRASCALLIKSLTSNWEQR
jgi:hypothetical protein